MRSRHLLAASGTCLQRRSAALLASQWPTKCLNVASQQRYLLDGNTCSERATNVGD